MSILAWLYLMAATLLVVWVIFKPFPSSTLRFVQVLVLGEIGHSPRMQYHALSLAKTEKFFVEIIGYPGSSPISELQSHPNVSIRYIRQFALNPKLKVPYVIYAGLKVMHDLAQLVWQLLVVTYRPDLVLAQTPPAIPTMVVCSAIATVRRSRLVFDFHNVAFMHLSEKIGASHPLVKVSRAYETFMARRCDHALCVTKAMQEYLSRVMHVRNVSVLYDRPGPQFKGRLSEKGIESLAARMVSQGHLTTRGDLCGEKDQKTFVVVSSTSWTPDEDFGLVLKALPQFDELLGRSKKKCLLVITGKGPCKAQFVREFSLLALSQVKLVTPWLTTGDYPELLGSAHVGISVHKSTSGLDLPMKVVDMFGAELPVVALKFPALSELLVNGESGLTFSDHHGLANCLARLTVADGDGALSKQFIERAKRWRESTWESEWTKVVLPIVEKLLE